MIKAVTMRMIGSTRSKTRKRPLLGPALLFGETGAGFGSIGLFCWTFSQEVMVKEGSRLLSQFRYAEGGRRQATLITLNSGPNTVPAESLARRNVDAVLIA